MVAIAAIATRTVSAKIKGLLCFMQGRPNQEFLYSNLSAVTHFSELDLPFKTPEDGRS